MSVAKKSPPVARSDLATVRAGPGPLGVRLDQTTRSERCTESAALPVKRGRMQYQDKGLMTIVLLADTAVHVR